MSHSDDKYTKPASYYEYGGVLRYCAPWCGAHCTSKDYDKAVAEAAQLAKHLGEGWVPKVWENLGWHYSVSRERLEVHPNTRWNGQRQDLAGYTAYLNIATQFVESSTTAHNAVYRVLKVARQHANQLLHDLAAFDKVVS